MAAATTNIELYQRLNTELVSMVDQFTNLIKATKEGLDADEPQQRPDRSDRQEGAAAAAGGPRSTHLNLQRVPGELLEVLVEKLLTAGHQCVHTVSELKKGAIISDFELLTRNVQQLSVDLMNDSYHTNRGLDHIRREAEDLLTRLEEHYYASAHKGSQHTQPAQPDTVAAAATLAKLCAQAQAMIDEMHA